MAGYVDSGRLPGARLPGTNGHRRVTRAALIKFMLEHGIPIPEQCQSWPRPKTEPEFVVAAMAPADSPEKAPDGLKAVKMLAEVQRKNAQLWSAARSPLEKALQDELRRRHGVIDLVPDP